ncbi:MAG: LamG domain-containing protein, partial [Gammaproteobacteria bacterium]|nr:LamG domain-containing protein [Gammaproteobacteria bacterium]
MSFNYSPNIITEGLVFYTDPFNFKSRDRSEGLTGGTIVDLTSSYGFEGTFTNEPEVSNDYKYITFDGTDDFILFPYSSAESFQEQMPFYRYKPKTFTFSSWVKSGTTGGGGVMFFGGGNDFFLKIPALTATTYTPGTYTGVIGENWSGTTTGQTSLNLPSFEVTIDSGGTITKAVAESISAIGGGSLPSNELVIVKLSGDTIGGSTPSDDAYLFWRSGTSSQMRWGFGIGNNYGMTIGDSIDRGTFTTDRVSNEPQEWNLITITDVGELVTNNLKCYVNGELVNQDTSTFLNGSQMNPGTINAGQINIGRGAASSFGTYLDGSLGPCMMYDRELSQNEIIRNYEALKNRFGPIKKLNFNRKSILLDGVDDYVDCGSAPFNSLSALSISAWVKPSAYGSASAESFVSTDSASPRGFYFGVYTSGRFRFSMSTNGANLNSLDTGGLTVDLNTWQHVLVTWDKVNTKFYKNGVLIATKATSFANNQDFTTTNDLLIGARRSSAGFFDG